MWNRPDPDHPTHHVVHVHMIENKYGNIYTLMQCNANESHQAISCVV
jgi:hypothetical protein